MTLSQQLICGELHYPRIPPEYWRHRLEMARAMGLNAVSTYVFWNVHEERRGEYRFDAQADIASFIRIAHELGLHVILRPGPYVCAEWDFGGLPAWLLRDGAHVRSLDPKFMDPVRSWLARLGDELQPFHARNGGPIIAVQLENEYGAFASDAAYLRELCAVLVQSGFGDLPVYTIDQPGDLHAGALDGVCAAVTFAPGDAGSQFVTLAELRPQQPLLCGEYWAGWFDHWGEPHAQLDDDLQVRDLEWMLRTGVSFNIYMFHGGTNFALWNGANAFDPHPYQPTVTSYDYEAALDERGVARAKYFRFRDCIAHYTQRRLAAPPEPLRAVTIDPFELAPSWPIDAALRDAVHAQAPLTMEDLGGSRGFVVYHTIAQQRCVGNLHLHARDYALVRVNGRTLAVQDRRFASAPVFLEIEPGASIEILVENGGRINYGPAFPHERKGILGDVRIGAHVLRNWAMWHIGPNAPQFSQPRSAPQPPCFYTGSFNVPEPGDTFLDVSALRKGVVWVNGRCAGRYWEEGPQRDLYIPGCWLHRGHNEVITLELLELRGTPKLRGGTQRTWSERRP